MTSLIELPGLLDPALARELAGRLASAPFSDGRATAQGSAREQKRNLQLQPSHPLGRELGARVVEQLARSEAFRQAALPHTILPFVFARYEPGMAYGDHLDLPVMGTPSGPLRTDLSLTIFLSDPAAYEGGELVVPIEGAFRRCKGAPGDAVLYPSDTIHQVAPVTSGVRLVAISWVQSLVRDAEARDLLAELALGVAALQRAGGSDSDVLRLRAVYHRLLRRWAAC